MAVYDEYVRQKTGEGNGPDVDGAKENQEPRKEGAKLFDDAA